MSEPALSPTLSFVTPRERQALPNEQPELRVIIVGQTGLEGALRRDPGIELVKTRTTLQAIGELSDPMETLGGRAAIVVVGQDADPGAEAERFLTAVKLVDPHTRVVVVRDDASAPYDAAYDGVIQSSTTAQSLRQFVMAPLRKAPPAEGLGGLGLGNLGLGGTGLGLTQDAMPITGLTHGPANAGRVHVPQPPIAEPKLANPAPTFVPPTAPPSSRHAMSYGDLADDLALVQAALVGRDVLAPALELMRQRCGADDLIFVPSEQPSDAPGITCVEVRHRDTVFGQLASSKINAKTLQPHADWLGCWLKLAQQQAELRRAALVDDLTGAWNRRYFERFMASAIERAGRERQTLSVMTFDIDNFKHYNDKYGHAAGDEILKQTVTLLKSTIRTSDRVCRIGGDEFVVVFYEPTGPRDPASRPPEHIWQIASRFQRQISEAKFPKLGSEAKGRLTVSGGLATYPWDGRSADELLDFADKLAMESKRSGKDKIIMGPDLARSRPPEQA